MPDTDLTKKKSIRDWYCDFVVKNRKDNLEHRTGWHERLQNIYVSHHRLLKPVSGKFRIQRKPTGG